MALKKDLMGNKGQMTSYHRIVAVAQLYGDGVSTATEQRGLQINLASYTSEQYRLAEKESGDEMIILNTPIVLPFEEGEDFSRAHLYERIKAEIQEFNDAQDC